jgi:uncharacterized protein
MATSSQSQPVRLARPLKPIQSVLVKPTGPDCNIDCAYCFYLKKASLFPEQKIHRMSLATLEELIRQVMQNATGPISFGWQGGEPTLMGLDFFRKAVEFQQRYGGTGQNVANGLQTNGTLITEEWCPLFRDFNFLIGLSLDGPRHVHDHYRLSKGGEPTWERVIKTARLFQRNKVEFNGLTVVNDYSAQFPEEIYDFHKSEGIRFMQFIPCVETDPLDPTQQAPFSVTPEAYGEFLCRVFDKWIKDFKHGKPTTSVRWFDAVLHTYVGMLPPECTLLRECGVYVVVEHNGDVYACDFFVEPTWKLGNLHQDDLLEMLNSDRQYEFGANKAKLPPECVTCEYLTHCQGGCPKDRQRNPRTQGSNHFCRSFKMFFAHAHSRLQRLGEQWIADQRRQAQTAPRRP